MLGKPYVDYIMAMAKETDMHFIRREAVEKLSFDEYQKVADRLDELYVSKKTSEDLDKVIKEVEEYGKEFVINKYGLKG